MKLINILLLAAFVFFIQFFLVDLLSLKMIRPDFLVIYIFYISLVFGKTPGSTDRVFLRITVRFIWSRLPIWIGPAHFISYSIFIRIFAWKI